MKRVSKLLSIVLIIAVIAAMTAGCGSSSTGEIKAPSSVSTGSEKTESKPNEPAETPDNASAEESNNEPAENINNAVEETADIAETSTEVSIEESVIFDQDGIKITAKSLDMTGFFGPEIKLLIENGSEKSVTVQSRNTSVNGYMIEPMLSADVAAGKKANDTLTLTQSDLDAAGITTIADIELSFHIFDSESWDTIIDSDPIRIETSAADGFEYLYDDSGDLVYNENGVEIVVKGLSEDGSWLGPSIVVYIKNTGDKNVTVQARDVSINDFMVEAVFSCDILSGKHAVDMISFMSSDLEANDINSIESVELSFHVYDMDTWDTIVDTSPVTINFD